MYIYGILSHNIGQHDLKVKFKVFTETQWLK
jgi:hypothetical protein